MKIQGIVEESNKRGVKLEGKWYDFYKDEEIQRVERGTEVEIEMRKGMILKLNIKTALEARPAGRPQTLEGFTEFAETSYGNLYVTINILEGKSFEILLHTSKSDHWVADYCEIIGKLVSLALGSGVSVKSIVEELQNNDKSLVSYSNGVAVPISQAVAQILSRNFVDEPRKEPENLIYFDDCPNCNTERSLVFQGGCSTCHSCGFTDCY